MAPPNAARRAATFVAVVALTAVLWPGVLAAGAARAAASYPVGVFDLDEPSGLAPPGPHALPGYHTLYVNDFTQPLQYAYWYLFSGQPKGDPSGIFEHSHVGEHDGELRIGTWRDHRRHDRWASGGICLCGVHPEFGAFFVRSRETAAGPDDAELLWPRNNTWPPELDFAETGISWDQVSWFDHYSPTPDAYDRSVRRNILQWHTWGIVWTPTEITLVVDGRAWGEVTDPAAIPDLPMVLDLQQETWCGIYPECPRRPSALLVDWLEVYVPNR